ncbi:MAG: hypothetical protein ABSB49_07540 [Polyangia bacterium]
MSNPLARSSHGQETDGWQGWRSMATYDDDDDDADDDADDFDEDDEASLGRHQQWASRLGFGSPEWWSMT